MTSCYVFTKMSRLMLFVKFLVLLRSTTAYNWYQSFIPNGINVPDPFSGGSGWPGVGHSVAEGGGGKNPFGRDFAVNLHVRD